MTGNTVATANQLLLRLLLACCIIAAPAVARAHAVVYPKASTTGGFEKYVLRVPNEKDVPTTRVEIRFPAGLRVTSFSEVAGWQLEVLKDSAGAIVGAVWTGSLAPKRFIEFPFVAANPKTPTRLVWPAYQTYAGGERVEWVGPKGSKRPASATEIATPPIGAGIPSFWLAVVALLLSIVSLGVALRRGNQAQN